MSRKHRFVAARDRIVAAGGTTPPPGGPGRSRIGRCLLLLGLAAVSFAVAYGAVAVWPWLTRGSAPEGMVWIPGGEFTMGTDADVGWDDEKPAHRIRVDGFWMDETEVSNAQ